MMHNVTTLHNAGPQLRHGSVYQPLWLLVGCISYGRRMPRYRRLTDRSWLSYSNRSRRNYRLSNRTYLGLIQNIDFVMNVQNSTTKLSNNLNSSGSAKGNVIRWWFDSIDHQLFRDERLSQQWQAFL